MTSEPNFAYLCILVIRKKNVIFHAKKQMEAKVAQVQCWEFAVYLLPYIVSPWNVWYENVLPTQGRWNRNCRKFFLLPSLFAFVFSSPCFLYSYLAVNWNDKAVFCAKLCNNIFNKQTGNSFVIKYLFLNTFFCNKAKNRKNIFSLQLKQYSIVF